MLDEFESGRERAGVDFIFYGDAGGAGSAEGPDLTVVAGGAFE